MAEKIRKATYSDADRLIVSLSRAFDDDPLINWFVRQDDKRSYGFEALFRTCLCTLSLPLDEVYATDDCIGGALWYPPGKSKIGLIRQLSILPSMIRVSSLRGLIRFGIVADSVEKVHPKKKHYYLQFLGVDPDHQGKGLGSALLRPVLQKCDREGCGAYLENSKEANLDFYKRHGFAVTDEINPGRGAPPLWLMWRNPR